MLAGGNNKLYTKNRHCAHLKIVQYCVQLTTQSFKKRLRQPAPLAATMTGSSDALYATKELVCELCRNFYSHGWVSGTGGGISIKHDDNQIVVAPSGVQKERMLPEDMFVLDNKGEIISTPQARPPPYKPPKLSECTPLFMAVGCWVTMIIRW